MTHPTATETREHRRTQRKLVASGFLPPRSVMTAEIEHCGTRWIAGERGVTHWPGSRLYLSGPCEVCGSHVSISKGRGR